jgi:hypothetical protein
MWSHFYLHLQVLKCLYDIVYAVLTWNLISSNLAITLFLPTHFSLWNSFPAKHSTPQMAHLYSPTMAPVIFSVYLFNICLSMKSCCYHHHRFDDYMLGNQKGWVKSDYGYSNVPYWYTLREPKVKLHIVAKIKVPNTNNLGLLLGIFSKTSVLSTFRTQHWTHIWGILILIPHMIFVQIFLFTDWNYLLYQW